MILDIIGSLFLITFFTFPMWIDGNWKTFTAQGRKDSRETKLYLKKEKERLKNIPIPQMKNEKKICTQYQPFQLTEKDYAICNFICDGDCQFKGTKYYIK
jgi:hypothetical protein